MRARGPDASERVRAEGSDSAGGKSCNPIKPKAAKYPSLPERSRGSCWHSERFFARGVLLKREMCYSRVYQSGFEAGEFYNEAIMRILLLWEYNFTCLFFIIIYVFKFIK